MSVEVPTDHSSRPASFTSSMIGPNLRRSLVRQVRSAVSDAALTGVGFGSVGRVDIDTQFCLDPSIPSGATCEGALLFVNLKTDPRQGSRGPFSNPTFEFHLAGYTEKSIDYMNFQNLEHAIVTGPASHRYFGSRVSSVSPGLTPGKFAFGGDFAEVDVVPDPAARTATIVLKRLDGSIVRYPVALQDHIGEAACARYTKRFSEVRDVVDYEICTKYDGYLKLTGYIANTPRNRNNHLIGADRSRCLSFPDAVAIDGRRFVAAVNTPRVELTKGTMGGRDVLRLSYTAITWQLTQDANEAVFYPEQLEPTLDRCPPRRWTLGRSAADGPTGPTWEAPDRGGAPDTSPQAALRADHGHRVPTPHASELAKNAPPPLARRDPRVDRDRDGRTAVTIQVDLGAQRGRPRWRAPDLRLPARPARSRSPIAPRTWSGPRWRCATLRPRPSKCRGRRCRSRGSARVPRCAPTLRSQSGRGQEPST